MKVTLKADLMYRSIDYGDQVLIEGEMTTVGDLKLYIEQHYHIPILNQILYYNGHVLAYNHVRHLSDVLVSNPNVALSIYTKRPPELVRVHVVIDEVPNGFYLDAHSTGTVLDLKERIDEKFGLSPHRQQITMIAKDPLHDWEVLDNYMIEDCPTIYLEKIPMDQEQLMCIRIKVNDSFTNVEVEKEDTIHTLHGIARNKGLASADDYKFYFLWGEEQLLGSRTFAWYEIPNDSTLSLIKVEKKEVEEKKENDDKEKEVEEVEEEDDGDDD